MNPADDDLITSSKRPIAFDQATYERHPNYYSLRISQLYTLLNTVTNSGFVDIRPILKELARLHGFDESIVAEFPTKR